jgi:hypothetical protein
LKDAPAIATKNPILAMELHRNSESKTLGSAHVRSSLGLWANRCVQTRMNLCGILARGQFQKKLFIRDLPGLIPFLRPIAGQGPNSWTSHSGADCPVPDGVLMRVPLNSDSCASKLHQIAVLTSPSRRQKTHFEGLARVRFVISAQACHRNHVREFFRIRGAIVGSPDRCLRVIKKKTSLGTIVGRFVTWQHQRSGGSNNWGTSRTGIGRRRRRFLHVAARRQFDLRRGSVGARKVHD